MKRKLRNAGDARFSRGFDPQAAMRTCRSRIPSRAVSVAIAVTLLWGGVASARDDDDEDAERHGGGNAAELRSYIGGQVGGIQKLRVPPNDAAIPVPFDPARPDRYKTTPQKRFLGKMLFHDPVRTARVNKGNAGDPGGEPLFFPRGHGLRWNVGGRGNGQCDRQRHAENRVMR